MSPLLACLRDRWPFRHTLAISAQELRTLLHDTQAEPWHYYAIRQRCWRRHICIASGWLADALPRDASIFEPGCGSGANLIWLAQRGFSHLSGSDISPNAVSLCRKLAGHFRAPLDIWPDNSLQPQRLPAGLDAILSVNWLYHVPKSSLADFLALYRHSLLQHGLLAFDMISADYNRQPNNQYHTEDWKKPEQLRRPSEYTLRLSTADVSRQAAAAGFQLKKTTHLHTCPPRDVYLLQKA